MNAMQAGMQILALAAASGALIVGVAALMARSLFAMCMYLAAFGALAACATLALGGGDAAVAVALLAGVLAPVFVLAAIVLSARAAKARRGVPWLSFAAAALSAGAVFVVLPEIGDVPDAIAPATSGVAFWLAPAMLAAAAACAAMLGYGERGALGEAAKL